MCNGFLQMRGYLFYPDIRSQRVGQQPTGNIERLPSSCTALPSCIHVRFADTDRTKYTYKCPNFATCSYSGKQIYQQANTASNSNSSKYDGQYATYSG